MSRLTNKHVADSSVFLAGAAAVDITPPAGTHLSGSGAGNRRPAQSVIDPLYVKAIVFESGRRRACVVAFDLTIITEECTVRVRDAVSGRFGIEPEAIMVHAMQTHSAPSCGNFLLDSDFPLETTPETEYLRGSEPEYSEFAINSAITAVEMAVDSLQPVQLGVGRGIIGDLAFNRRGVKRDGTIIMPKPTGRQNQPWGITDLCYLEGPVDPEVGVACLRTADMNMAAMLMHYTCHPVNVFGHQETYYCVSSDWPGTWTCGMQDVYGSTCMPIVLNGCCGNINPWDPYDPDATPDHRRMGRQLSDMACRIIHGMTFVDDAKLDWRVRRVPLQYRDIPEKRLAEVNRILDEHPQPKPRDDDPNGIDSVWFRAATTKSVEYCRKRMPELPYEIQVLRIGDIALVGLPGEPFVEGQLAIKTQSPAPYTFVAHMTSQYVGYLPIKEAFARGGHEANEDVTFWSKLAPDSLDIVVSNAREMVAELFNCE